MPIQVTKVIVFIGLLVILLLGVKENAHSALPFHLSDAAYLDPRNLDALGLDPKTLGEGACNPVDNDLPVVVPGYALALRPPAGGVFPGQQSMIEGL
jgi:hypothetical protein